MADNLRAGVRVRLHSLQAATHHNDAEGYLLEWNDMKGRWDVRLSSGEVLSVRPANLLSQPEQKAVALEPVRQTALAKEDAATTPPKPPLLRGRTVSECGKPPPVRRGKLVRCPKKVGAGPAQTVAFKATSWTKPRATSKHFACGLVQPHAGSVASWFQQIMDGEALEPTEFHEFAVNTLLKSKHCRRS